MSSIVESVINYSTTTPDKTAIIYKDNSITYKELARNMQSFASALKNRKISKNSRVLLEADDIISYISGVLGCQLYGCIAVPIERNVSIYKLQRIMSVTKPKLVFIGTNGESYEEYLSTEPTHRFKMPKDDAIVSITCTTGTTGKPSLITHTNASTVATAQNLSEATDITSETVMFTNMPFDLAAGYRRVFTALYNGATMVASNNRFCVDELQECVEKYGVDYLSLVCTDISSLVNNVNDTTPFMKLRVVESAAGELTPSITTSFYQKFTNSILYNVYGTTESGIILTNDTRVNHVDNCLGKPTVNTTIQLIDENGDTVTKPGKYGYVAVSGGMNMQGYYKKKDATEQVMSNNRLILKDIVYFDEEGYYYFVSRVGGIINVQGHKVTPLAIESVAKQFPGLKDCACVGKKDDVCGQVPILYIECEEEGSVDVERLKKYLEMNLEEYCVPKEIVPIDKIPRTFTGKLMRKSLTVKL